MWRLVVALRLERATPSGWCLALRRPNQGCESRLSKYLEGQAEVVGIALVWCWVTAPLSSMSTLDTRGPRRWAWLREGLQEKGHCRCQSAGRAEGPGVDAGVARGFLESLPSDPTSQCPEGRRWWTLVPWTGPDLEAPWRLPVLFIRGHMSRGRGLTAYGRELSPLISRS